MRAMVFTKPGVVEMLDVDPPTPRPDEELVDVAAVGICGSELHGILRPDFRRPPLVMGHEFAGTTADGRRVTVNPLVSCGACDLCEAGHDHLCRRRAIIGIHRPGAFAEQVTVPRRLLHELPDGMTWDQAAMIEPLANAVHAWRLGNAGPGGRVAVIGAGAIGLVSLLVARRHASEVVVADLSPERLAVAAHLGADTVGEHLDGEFDVVVDAVGAPATHAASLGGLKPGGTAVWIGLLSSEAAFDAQALVRGEQTVRGSYCYRAEDFAEAVVLAGEVDLGWTATFALEEGAQIFTELMNGRTDIVKAVLRP